MKTEKVRDKEEMRKMLKETEREGIRHGWERDGNEWRRKWKPKKGKLRK
jgi:hypothetical protein